MYCLVIKGLGRATCSAEYKNQTTSFIIPLTNIADIPAPPVSCRSPTACRRIVTYLLLSTHAHNTELSLPGLTRVLLYVSLTCVSIRTSHQPPFGVSAMCNQQKGATVHTNRFSVVLSGGVCLARAEPGHDDIDDARFITYSTSVSNFTVQVQDTYPFVSD